MIISIGLHSTIISIFDIKTQRFQSYFFLIKMHNYCNIVSTKMYSALDILRHVQILSLVVITGDLLF